jgi:hypothetical protein
MHEVEDLAQVPAETIQGVDDDRVAAAGIGQQRTQAVAFDGGAGLLVGEDSLVRDAVVGRPIWWKL